VPEAAEPEAAEPEAAEPEAAEPEAAEPVEAEAVEPEPAGDPAAAAPADGAAAPPAPAAPAPDAPDPLSSKQRRRLARSRFSGTARPQRSPDERARDRSLARSTKGAERARWRQRRDRKRADGAQAAPTPSPEPRAASGIRKVRQGMVVSAKPDKTITVQIDVMRTHPRYGKVVRNKNTFQAHDERNQAGEGDVVRVVECRPLSRTKRWRLLEVVQKAR
jgi:small subunit ribosomal protein S17